MQANLPIAPTDTVLEPPETSVPHIQKDTIWGTWASTSEPSVVFRHSGWAHQRNKVYAALERTRSSIRSLDRFALCGSDPWIAVDRNDPTHYAVLANHCHCRWCVPCAIDRAHTISANLLAKVDNTPHRFMTLTLKASDLPLKTQLNRLYTCFRALRASDLWKDKVTGGAAVLEVKYAWHRHGWHPHLHIIFAGRYISRTNLSAEWYRITKDSFIVDVRMIPNNEAVARYVTKYVSKPFSRTVINKPDALDELILALRGRRLVLTFGSWRGFRLTRSASDVDWKVLCPIDEFLDRQCPCNAEHQAVLHNLVKSVPDIYLIAGRAPPEEAPF